MAGNNKRQSRWLRLVDRVRYHTKQIISPVSPSETEGMGAVPGRHGTAFRVWAPYADRVFVTGSFNDWSQWRSPLAHEDNGHWSVDIAEADLGDEYKFVVHNGSQTLLRTDPYARAVTNENGNSIICGDGFDWNPKAGSPPYESPGWHELVIYELHVGTFAQDPDNVVGTFRAVINKLPYLQELGINAIELMPIKEFAGDYSWGYNPGHPFAVTQTYGGRHALKELVKAAHEHGIAVILDVVYNHFGPQDLSLWRYDGWYENDLGGIYFYNDWRAETPWAHTRPDYGRREVRRYIRDNVLMWLEEYRVDGLRWDTTNFIRNAHGRDGDPGADIPEGWDLLRWVSDEIDARQSWKISIAEDLQANPRITAETRDDGAGFDAQWDVSFVDPIRQAITTPHDEDRDMAAVRDAIAFRYNGDVFERVIYTESHDEVANGRARVPEEIAPGDEGNLFAKKRSALGAALVFTAPGIPMIFQGQEFLQDCWFDDHVPLDWSKAEKNAGILTLYRDLIRLRRNWHENTHGLLGQHVHVHHVDNDAKVIAFHRWHHGGPRDDVIVVANFANRLHQGYTIGFPHSGIWRVRFNSDERTYDKDFGDFRCPDVVAAKVMGRKTSVDQMPCFGNVTLAPYSVLILSQD
jgi:1,4-alpha-glucan branching enzyme